jgi:hypothetical protein
MKSESEGLTVSAGYSSLDIFFSFQALRNTVKIRFQLMRTLGILGRLSDRIGGSAVVR